jgi:tRNA(Ser,Leu) C12 N-acetylase TAN1
MAKKDIEKALDEINEAADKALKEAKETKMEVRAWLKQTRSFTYAELLVVALGVVVIVATAGNI